MKTVTLTALLTALALGAGLLASPAFASNQCQDICPTSPPETYCVFQSCGGDFVLTTCEEYTDPHCPCFPYPFCLRGLSSGDTETPSFFATPALEDTASARSN